MNTQMQMPERMVAEQLGSEYHVEFTLNPLEEGYGVTIGNALRRVLLSSIPGTAIVGVKITDVLHEFQTIPGVVEDMCEIILNLKEVRLRVADKKAPTRITFSVKGGGQWKASSIGEACPEVEVLDPEKVIANLAADADFDVEIRLGRGTGYVPAEEQVTTEFPVGMLPIDAIYTPIKNVIYRVEPFRVGQKTDYEKLTLNVLTDGSITAEKAVEEAAQILNEHIRLFRGAASLAEERGADAESGKASQDREFQRLRRLLLQPVDELELSVRAHNCLKAANIKILAELVSLQETDLLKFRNFGRKSLAELTDVVYHSGLTFGMDVTAYIQDELKESE
ncbi:MAG: DNA-directed RNA polymerase subunit alpha [Bradyrhizobiaceae bacterium]|nr:DNA-directed RNA polymerase subunit alpha [Bradyrhizobiaceae bacterium]